MPMLDAIFQRQGFNTLFLIQEPSRQVCEICDLRRRIGLLQVLLENIDQLFPAAFDVCRRLAVPHELFDVAIEHLLRETLTDFLRKETVGANGFRPGVGPSALRFGFSLCVLTFSFQLFSLLPGTLPPFFLRASSAPLEIGV